MHHRRLASLCCLLLLPAMAVAQPRVTGEMIADRLNLSTVLIIAPQVPVPPMRPGTKVKLTRYAMGTGVFIGYSKNNRVVVLTNYHVVQGGFQVRVAHDSFCLRRLVGAQPKADLINDVYQVGKDVGLLAKLPEKDLALLEVDLPGNHTPGLSPLYLAQGMVRAGQEVHTIGCSPAAGLFNYSKGNVRAVGPRELTFFDDNKRKSVLKMNTIETSNPINSGDSGGPLVNEKAELIGLAQARSVNASLVAVFIDLSEIRRFLNHENIIMPKPAPVLAAEAEERDEKEREPRKSSSSKNVRREIDERSPLNWVAAPQPPAPPGPRTVITFKTGYLARQQDQSWTYQEYRRGQFLTGTLTEKKRDDRELVLHDPARKRYLRMTDRGLEESHNAKDWDRLDPDAKWN